MEASTPLVEECSICCTVYDRRDNKKITCFVEACKKNLCRGCFFRITSDSSLTPSCLWCKTRLPFAFIVKSITEKQLKIFMSKRSDGFLDREKSQLPYLQEEAETIIRKKNALTKYGEYALELCELNNEFTQVKTVLRIMHSQLFPSGSAHFTRSITEINCNRVNFRDILLKLHRSCYVCDVGHTLFYRCKSCDIRICKVCLSLEIVANDKKCFHCDALYVDDLPNSKTKNLKNLDMPKIKEDIKNLIVKKMKVNQRYYAICDEINNIQHGPDALPNLGEDIDADVAAAVADIEKATKAHKQFIKKCPDINCRGFLSSQWKCGICECNFCVDCHERKDKGHVCNEDEKATIAALKTESKPCPRCGMPISRISGCSQVWTPCCKIAFDWNTGKIDEGRIHSPEYFAYIQRTVGAVPRERDDIPCGGGVDEYTIARVIPVPVRDKYQIYNIYRLKLHVTYSLLPQLPRETDEISHRDLGIKYLISEITEESWKSTLSRREKRRDKNIQIYDILQTFVTVMNDLLGNLVYGSNTVEDRCKDFETVSLNLIKYTNEEVQKINDVYKSVEKKYMLKLV